jgi:hypothetical protein
VGAEVPEAGASVPAERTEDLAVGGVHCCVYAAIAAAGLLRLARPAADADGAAGRSAPPEVRVRRTSLRFLALTLVNPLTALFAAIVVGLGLVAGASARVLFVAAAFAASLVCQGALAAFGALIGARLPPRAGVGTTLVGHLIVAGLAVPLAAT